MVEPTAGVTICGIATSQECILAPLRSMWTDTYLANGTAGVIDASLSELVHDYEYSNESLLTCSSTRLINELILFCVFNRDKDAVITCGAVLWWLISQPRVWLFTATCVASPIAQYVGLVLPIITHVVDTATYAIVFFVFSVEPIIKLAFILPYLTLRLALDAARFASLTALLGTARVSLIAIDVSMIALRASAATVGMSGHLPRLTVFRAAETLLQLCLLLSSVLLAFFFDASAAGFAAASRTVVLSAAACFR